MRCVHLDESVCFPGPLPGGCCIRPTPPGPSQPPLLSQQDTVCPIGPAANGSVWAVRVCQLSARHSVSPSVGLLAAGTPAENTVPIRIQLQPGLSSVLNTGSWQSCYTEQLQFSLRCVIMLTESDATCSSNTDTPQTVTRCGLFYLHFLPVGPGKAAQNNLLRSVLSGELKVLISPHHTASGSSCH